MSFYPNFGTSSIDSNLNANAVAIQGTSISSAGANDNDILTYDLATDKWQPEPAPVPPITTTLYTGNGTITGNRVVSVGFNSLIFKDIVTDFVKINQPLGEVGLVSPVQIDLDSPLIRMPSITGAIKPDVLYYDIITHRVSFGTAPADTNIYTADGTLTGNRTLNTGANSLTITNGSKNFLTANATTDFLDLQATRITLDGAISLTQTLPPNNALTAIMMRDPADTQVKTRSVASLPNIYTADGSLGANRTVSTAGFSLAVSNGITNLLSLSTAQSALNNATSISLTAPTITLPTTPTANNANTVLLTRNTVSGNIETRTVASLPAPTGTANTVAVFDGSGNLSSSATLASTKITASNGLAWFNGSQLLTSVSNGFNIFGGSGLFAAEGSTISAINSIAVGGVNHTLSAGGYQACLGGNLNTISSAGSNNTIIGGQSNTISNVVALSTIIGGFNTTLNGIGNGTCVINDSQATANAITEANALYVKMSNGMRLTSAATFSTPITSALLQMDSTTKGLLPPRMTTAQKNAIVSPTAGLVVYDTTLGLYQVYDGAIWRNYRANAIQIQGVDINATTPTTGQYLCYNGSQWIPSTINSYNSYIRLNPNGNFANNQYTQTGGQSSTESTGQSLIFQTSTIIGFRVNLTVAPGVGNSRTFTIRKNGVATALVITITDGNTTGSITGSVSMVAGDLVSSLHTASGAAASQGQIVIAIRQD